MKSAVPATKVGYRVGYISESHGARVSHKKREEQRKPRPWEHDREGGTGSFGAWLKSQREIREISLREISDVTKINLRYLEALEQDRFSVLPAEVFARGFLREYAKYVGLDPDEVVNYFRAAQQDSEPESRAPDQATPSRLHSSTQWAYGVVLTAGVLALFGVVALVSFWAERRSGSESGPPPIAAPVFSSPPAAIPGGGHSRAPLEVTLDFTQDCWVEAVLDERERISELRVQGESLRLTARRSVSLTLGNAAGVRIEVNGQPFEIAGGDEVVRDLEITLDSIQGQSDERMDEPAGPSL